MIKRALYSFIIIFTVITPAHSSEEDNNIGIIESIEAILDIHKKQIKNIEKKIEDNKKNIDNKQQFKINPIFMLSILFHSDPGFISLIKNKDCSFYSLLNNGLIKYSSGSINHLLIDITNKDNKEQTIRVDSNKFINYIHNTKCIKDKNISRSFRINNIGNIFNQISFTIPKTNKECSKIMNSWKNSIYLPYLCKIPKYIDMAENYKNNIYTDTVKQQYASSIVDTASLYKEQLSIFKRIYLKNLCSSLINTARFCSSYIEDSLWNNIITGEKPKYLIEHKCKNIFNKKKLTLNEIKSCSAILKSNPKICISRGTKNKPSFFPMTNCRTIGQALKESNLKTNYHDCPGNIDHHGMTNIYRIIRHISKDKIDNSNMCYSNTNYIFSKLIQEEDIWDLKVCYFDSIIKEKVCKPYVPGSNKSEISEDKVISEAIMRFHKLKINPKCKIINEKEYNPLLLKYKVGCFVLINPETCTTTTCKKKIIYDTRLITGIKYKGSPSFKYVHSSFSNKKKSIKSILDETYNIKTIAIKNAVKLKSFLKDSKKIIHGIGCAEDILPRFFKRRTINQCNPLPFILDGIKSNLKEDLIVIRTSIEDIHSPRLTNWSNLFNSVKNYSENHPLKLWTLYGIN